MKKLYIFIFSLTIDSVCKAVMHIVDYLDLRFLDIQRESNVFFHPYYTNIHSYTNILFIIKICMRIVRVLCIILLIIFLIIIILDFMKKYSENSLNLLEKCTIIFKMGLIPFWILQLCFIIHLIYNYSIKVYYNNNLFFINSGVVFDLIFYFALSYFFLLISSIFSIGYFYVLFRNNIIDRKTFKRHKIMQFFFVFDCMSIFYIIRKRHAMMTGTP